MSLPLRTLRQANKLLQAMPLRSWNVGFLQRSRLSDQIVVFVIGGAPELCR